MTPDPETAAYLCLFALIIVPLIAAGVALYRHNAAGGHVIDHHEGEE